MLFPFKDFTCMDFGKSLFMGLISTQNIVGKDKYSAYGSLKTGIFPSPGAFISVIDDTSVSLVCKIVSVLPVYVS